MDSSTNLYHFIVPNVRSMNTPYTFYTKGDPDILFPLGSASVSAFTPNTTVKIIPTGASALIYMTASINYFSSNTLIQNVSETSNNVNIVSIGGNPISNTTPGVLDVFAGVDI